MAGRRLREAVKMVLTSGRNGEFNSNVHVVIAGLTNAYSQYVTTFEEYQVQRYEVCCFKFSKTIFASDIEDKSEKKPHVHVLSVQPHGFKLSTDV